MRILSGITPSGSGRLHIGNYLGAIRQFVLKQEQGEELFIFIADLHALTSLHDAPQLQRNIYEVAAAYLALGLDPEKTTLYRQSDIQQIPELMWYLSSLAPMGLLERAHAYKDKTAKGLAASVGLFTYPILMAADILIMKPAAVPVGRDQKQHVEIARDLAEKFNATFGEVFPLPEPVIPEQVAVVPGTDGDKMSKSYGNTIDLFAEDKVVEKQIMGIKTDSTPKGSPLDPVNSIVFTLYRLLDNGQEDTAQLWDKYLAGTVGHGDAKKLLVTKFHQVFDSARARFTELMADTAKIDAILAAGAAKAQKTVQPVMEEVRRKVGIAK